MKNTHLIFLASLGLVACNQEPRQYTMAEAREICSEERREAEGPTGNVTIGSTSEGRAFGGVSININESYIRGYDPEIVYESCMNNLNIVESGQ